MRIVVHAPVVEAPDGTEHVAAAVLAALEERIRRLGADVEAAPADERSTTAADADESLLERPAEP